MPLKDLKKLSPKHKQLVRHVIDGMSSQQAAQRVGLEKSYGTWLMKQPIVRSYLVQQMEHVGITDSYLAEKLIEGLNAETVPRREGGKRYDDQFVRKQFIDLICRIRGDYAPEKHETTSKSIVIVMNDKMVEALTDSKAITQEEGEILEAEIVGEDQIKENNV